MAYSAAVDSKRLLYIFLEFFSMHLFLFSSILLWKNTVFLASHPLPKLLSPSLQLVEGSGPWLCPPSLHCSLEIPPAEIQGELKVLLVYFLSVRGHSSVVPVVQFLKTLLHIFCPVLQMFVVWFYLLHHGRSGSFELWYFYCCVILNIVRFLLWFI